MRNKAEYLFWPFMDESLDAGRNVEQRLKVEKLILVMIRTNTELLTGSAVALVVKYSAFRSFIHLIG